MSIRLIGSLFRGVVVAGALAASAYAAMVPLAARSEETAKTHAAPVRMT